MKLTGLQIFKLLPNKNCKECGFQTCLAFAMKLAAKQVSLEACPYVSDEAKEKLGEASAPPIRPVRIGSGENAVTVGEELVMFRHEKTFVNRTAIAAGVDDRMAPDELLGKVKSACSFSVERAGETLKIDLIAVRETSGEPKRFADTVRAVTENCPLPLILMSAEPACLNEGLKISSAARPLLWGGTRDNLRETASIAGEFKVPLVVGGENGIEKLAELACLAEGLGVKEIVLAPSPATLAERLRDFTILRRLALERGLKGAGFPLIAEIKGSGYGSAVAAAAGICKYASIMVMANLEQWEYLPLLTLRQNIYTDPQKPLQVEPDVYSIGNTDEGSPLLVTTNFSLTYFMVSNEVEASEVPSKLLIVEAEGQSVLTAWAAGKFNAEAIAKAVKERELEKSVRHRRIVIPGYVAMLSGELEDKLPGWNVMVGPQESADIPAYLRDVWNK